MDFDEILTKDKAESILSEKAQKSQIELGIDIRLKKLLKSCLKEKEKLVILNEMTLKFFCQNLLKFHMNCLN